MTLHVDAVMDFKLEFICNSTVPDSSIFLLYILMFKAKIIEKTF